MTITADDITCKRGDRIILTGVSFSVSEGACLVLRGPNGVGKSTLLRALAGLASVAAGRLTVDADKTVYAGHLDAVKGQLTVTENLGFWAGVYGSDNLGKTMERLALTDLGDRHAHSLSAGQKRRLGLARLLLAKREIWLLDEPTVSLDADNVRLFEQVFQEHLAASGTLILSSHLDIGLNNPTVLDLSPFKPDATKTQDPFLEGTF